MTRIKRHKPPQLAFSLNTRLNAEDADQITWLAQHGGITVGQMARELIKAGLRDRMGEGCPLRGLYEYHKAGGRPLPLLERGET